MPSDLTAFLLSVGDELLSGLTVDTNSAHLSRELAGLGVRVVGHATVGDDQPTIETAIRDAAGRAELLVVSGGIGPTPDDLTREALANVIGTEVVEDASWVAQMEKMFAERGRVMKPGNRKQAGVPAGAAMLWNPVGTAAGVRAEIPTSGAPHSSLLTPHPSATVFVVPGVPKEMRAMAEQHLVPWVREQVKSRGGKVIKARAIHTYAIGESDLAARLGEMLRRDRDDGMRVGTTASRGVVSVRAYATAADEAAAVAALDAVERQVRDELGDLVFGVDEQTLAEAVFAALRGRADKPTVATAESCTGGLIAKLLTDVAGSSEHFHRGFVTYSNAAKTELLGVPTNLIERHGAVSGPVVEAMARGATPAGGVAISVSGVAGPGGGSDDKPVGTVFLGLAADDLTFSRRFSFPGDRETVRLRSAYMALTLLRFHLLGHDLDQLPF